MIAYRMLYAVAVGLPVLAACHGVAAVLRRHGKAERWVWLAGLCLLFVLPSLYLAQPVDPSSSDASGSGAVVGRGADPGVQGDGRLLRFPNVILVEPGDPGFGLDEALLLAWLLASAGLALRWLVSTKRLVGLTESWSRADIDGTNVWLTPASGPAVTGVLRSRILVPGWLLELPSAQRSLVMLHEGEHLRARDPWLMALCRLARLLTPWNPVVWALSARLLRAVEMDCDRRVLRHRPDVRAYCDTLFAISARRSSRPVGAAAFAEPRVPLHKRIVAMTTPSRSISLVGATIVLALGALLVVASCGVPLPTDRATDPRQSVVGAADERIVPVSLTADGRVGIDGRSTAWDDVSGVVAALGAVATQPLVARIQAPTSVPYRYVDRLEQALVDGGLTRVIFAVGGSSDELSIVLPERLDQVRVSGRNVLRIEVGPTGRMAVRHLGSEEVRIVDPEGLTAIWREEVADNPRLIASLASDPDATYAQVMAALDALHEANAQRIALMGQSAQ